jgi:5-methylthioadenosine/S-adenosylhomocysteine deaminase
MELARSAVERWHEPGGLIQIGLGPSAPQRCSDELLAETMALAEDRDLVWHTHALETRTQRLTALEWHGRSFLEVLAERGLLGPRTAIAHAIWLTERDVELLAETRTTLLHCLCSNLRLGDGIAPLLDLRDTGVRIALGTDGRGCDETLDMVELMKMTALVQVRGRPFEQWTSAAEVFRMATEGASRCTGNDERLGRLEPGACGDVLLLERGSLAFSPMHDPVRQLFYGVASRDVRTVVVGGRIIVEDGRVPGVDLDSLLERAERYGRHEAPAGRTADLTRLEQIVRGVWDRAESADVGVDAYAR